MTRSPKLYAFTFGAAVVAALVCVFLISPIDAHAASQSLALLGDPTTGLGIGLAFLGRTAISQLKAERNELARECRDLLDKTPKDKWGEAETKIYDEKMDQVARIDDRIDREQRLLDATAETKFKEIGAGEKGSEKISDARKAFNMFVGRLSETLSAEEFTAIRNTMSTGTGSQGGYTVPSEIASELIETLKDFGGMRSASRLLRTTDGRALSFPTTDGTAEVGEIVAENAAGTGQSDPTFGTAALNVYKFTSKIIVVPIELFQDSVIDIESFVMDRLRERLARATNQYFTTGTGSSQPTGVVTGSSSGKVGTTGQTLTVIYDDLVDLQHSVDPAYRRLGAAFMMADSSLKVIRKIKDSQGRPIFVPGYEAGVPGGVPDTLLGSPIIANNDMPAMAANAKSIIYGDLKKYYIRDAMDVVLRKYEDSNYARLGQVGFQGWLRSGGNLLDTGAVKYYQNSAT